MTSQEWAAMRAVIEDALPLPLEQQVAFLAGRLATAEQVHEARRLLAGSERAASLFPIESWSLDIAAPEAPAGLLIGDYRILRELGRGGMGAVYLAERADGLYEHKVAIKVMQDGILTPALAERFRQERQILARLNHPGIARLLDGGVTPEGRQFFVLEYVDGTCIDEYCEEKSLSNRERLKIFAKIAEAVQSAHQQLVLHLDLKPANILITKDGEPKLLDFGIARILTEVDASSSRDGSTLRLLTPRYASPEQAEGAPLGVGSDVFSLATLLYRLLTGKLPYPLDDASPLEAVRILRETPPQRPSEAAPAASRSFLTGDLDTILLQGLRKEPERRYPTVAAFHEDIERFLRSEPVTAHADSFRYRAGKFVRRNTPAVAAAAIAALVLGISSIAVVHATIVAREQRATAERRLKDMRNLAHSYVFDLDPRLENIAGTVEVRHFVLGNAQKYLEAMSSESRGDDDLTRETAEGYSRIGQVLGTPNTPSMSDYKAADAAMSKGIELQRSLVNRHPDDLKERGILLQQMRHYAAAAEGQGDLARKQQLLLESWDVGQPILAAGPSAPRFVEMSYIAESLGSNDSGEGDGWDLADPASAPQWFDRATEISRRALKADPSLAKRSSMHSHQSLEAVDRAEYLMRAGRSQEARPYFLKAIESASTGEKTVYREQNLKIFRALYLSYLLQIHDVTTAAELAPQVLRDAADPGQDRTMTIAYASSLVEAGRLDLQMHRVARGKARVLEAVKTLSSLYDVFPEDAVLSAELGWDCLRIADENSLDLPTRKMLYLRAEAVAARFRGENPQVLSAAMLLGRCELGLAALAGQAHDVQAQADHAAASARYFSQVLSIHPLQPEAEPLRQLAQSYLK